MLIEPFAGTAIISHHISGNSNFTAYQGSKFRYRKEISNIIVNHHKPESFVLSDTGPFGITNKIFSDQRLIDETIEKLILLSEQDPATVYYKLHNAPVPSNLTSYASEHLYLQRIAFSGKQVSGMGTWKSPGYNKTSAEGKKKTELFSEIKPQIPQMIKKLKLIKPFNVMSYQQSAIETITNAEPNAIYYLDPPYANTTQYQDDFTELDLKNILDSLNSPKAILLSETKPYDLGKNTYHVDLKNKKTNQSFKHHLNEILSVRLL